MQTRRLWVTGVALAGLAAGSTASVDPAPKKAPARKPASRPPASPAARTPAKPAVSAEPVYSVVSPLGDPTVKMITMAPRLDTLAGMRVCMVWNQAFKADITLPEIERAVKEKYPDVKIIPYTEIEAAIEAADRPGAAAQPSAPRPRPGARFGARGRTPGPRVPPVQGRPAPGGGAAAADEDDASREAAILQAVLKEKGCEALISGNGG